MLVTALPIVLAMDIDKAKMVGDLAPCVLWRDVEGRKVPVNGSGKRVNALDAANQMTFATAAAAYAAGRKEFPPRYTGIGVVLTGAPRADGLVLTVLDYDAKGDITVEERQRRAQVADEPPRVRASGPVR